MSKKQNTDADIEVDDELGDEVDTPLVEYQITSYGGDFDVYGLVRRLNNKKIVIPEFQRSYVWKQPEASRFIESLLLGLPVPGIFLAKQQEGEVLDVIDGQQRLKSLQYFYQGFFKPKEGEKNKKVFDLQGVQNDLAGKTYETLTESQRTKLDDSLLHAVIIKQTSPSDDNTAIFHIFERLNSEGKKLTDQEIRCAVYYGDLIKMIAVLNAAPEWRYNFSKESERQKDRELILRFLALYYYRENYRAPMSDFLNRFTLKYRNANRETLNEFVRVFTETIRFIINAVPDGGFKLVKSFNAAVFDSVMVVLRAKWFRN